MSQAGTFRPAIGEKPLLPLRARRLALYLGLLAVFAMLAQLALGGSIEVIALALLATLLGLAALVAFGGYNLGAWVSLFYALGNVLIALYAKTLLGQPIDSELYAPLDSFAAIACSSGALCAALWLVRHIPVGRPIFAPVDDPSLLVRFSWVSFALGAVFWLLNRFFQDPGGDGFGGIALFRDLLYMAIIARTAALLEQSGNRQAFDSRLGVLMAICVLFGLIDSSKAMVALSVISHFATVLFYRRGLPARSIAVLATGGVIFVGFVAPAIHALRAMGEQELTLSQRIELIRSSGQRLLDAPGQFKQFEQLAGGQFESGYYNYFGGNATGQMLLGRYASVQQIDPVVAGVNGSQPWGGEAVWPALSRLLPRFIYPDKPQYSDAYNTLVHYGFVDPEGGKFPTLPLAGQAYAAYGWLGVLTIPFLTFFCFLLVLKKLGWQLYRNIYAIFFFCSFVIVYASQGDFSQYVIATLRNFPLFALMFLLMSRVSRVRLGRRHRTPQVPQTRHPVQNGGVEMPRGYQSRMREAGLTKAR